MVQERNFCYEDLYRASLLNPNNPFERDELVRIYRSYITELNSNKKFLRHTLLLLSKSDKFLEEYMLYVPIAFEKVSDVKNFFENEIRRNITEEKVKDPAYFWVKLNQSFGISDSTGTFDLYIFKRILEVYIEKELLFEIPKCSAISSYNTDEDEEFNSNFAIKELLSNNKFEAPDFKKVKGLLDLYYNENIENSEDFYIDLEQNIIEYLIRFMKKLQTDIEFTNIVLSNLVYNSEYILNVERYIIYSNSEVIYDVIYSPCYMDILQNAKKALNIVRDTSNIKEVPMFAYYPILEIFQNDNLYNMFTFKWSKSYSDYKMLLPIFYEILKVFAIKKNKEN